ncbi:hypothetical protein [Propioniciclava flava]
MRQVIREGVKTKVLMLSATPVNNRFNDLKNQLQLAYEGESENLAQHLSLSTTVEKVFSDAQRVFNEWSKLDPEHRTTDRILQMLDFDFFELLDSVTIARSRKHIQAFYDTTEIGAFPERRPPLSIREPLTDLPDVPGFNDIFEQLQALNLAVYTPLTYVFPSRRSNQRRPLQRHRRERTIQPRAGRTRAGVEEAHDRQPAQTSGEFGRCLPSHLGEDRRVRDPHARAHQQPRGQPRRPEPRTRRPRLRCR